MKKALLFIALISLIMSCNAQTERTVNKEVLDILMKDKFNLEIFELSFCINEILNIIENDSSYYKILNDRISKAFDNNKKEEILYIHTVEFEFFQQMIKSNASLKNKYPDGYWKIQQIKPTLLSKTYSNYSEVFKAYVEYPEQVDNICLIMLTCKIDCKFFDDVQNDKIAQWKYNNWLDYGYEEFRHYPGTLNAGKGNINNRIIDYILKTKNCQDNPLANKSIEMIKSITEKH